MLQTEIAWAIVSQIPVEIRDEELLRLQNRHTPRLRLRAHAGGAPHLTIRVRTATPPRARSCSWQSPRSRVSPAPGAYLSYTHVQDLDYGWTSDRRRAETTMTRRRCSTPLVPQDYDSHWAVGIAALRTDDFVRALQAYERAVALEPQRLGAARRDERRAR